MDIAASDFPQFPPGLWRRIALHPGPGLVVVGLEDDPHRFTMRMAHKDGVIVSLEAVTERAPWSTCPDAGAFLAEQLVGQRLEAVADRDPTQHCTHLLDLAVLCAAQAGDPGPTIFDMQVADRVEERTTATLFENGEIKLEWRLTGTLIEGPDDWAGRDLRRLSRWKTELSAEDALRAALLRRAIFVSGARSQGDQLARRASEQGPTRLGVCFTYQMPRAQEAVQDEIWRRDFSQDAAGPLQNFDP